MKKIVHIKYFQLGHRESTVQTIAIKKKKNNLWSAKFDFKTSVNKNDNSVRFNWATVLEN